MIKLSQHHHVHHGLNNVNREDLERRIFGETLENPYKEKDRSLTDIINDLTESSVSKHTKHRRSRPTKKKRRKKKKK